MYNLKQTSRLSISRGVVLFITILLTATIVPQILNIRLVSADDGGYPWIDAHALYAAPDYSSSYGYALPCPAKDTECDKGGSSLIATVGGVTYGEADTWHYGLRNCTSYAAWKINQVFGVTNISGWGNGKDWDTGLYNSQPYTVYSASGHTPQVGEIAQWESHPGDTFGHVAYVWKVETNGVADLYEYNQAYDGNFNGTRTTASGSDGTPDHYIHIGTVQSNTNNDIDGDQHSDLMFHYKLGDNGTNFYTFSQSSSFVNPAFTQQFANTSGWNWNQMKITTGDVDNDGKSDMIMLHKTSDGGANLYVFYGGSYANNISPVRNFPGNLWSWDNMTLLSGDFDGDHHADVMLLYKLSDNSINLYIFTQTTNFQNTGWVRTYPNSSGWNWNLVKVATGDADNDGISDLYMLHKLTDGGANFYVLHGGSAAFGDYSNPTRNFPGNTWLWDNMKMLTGDFDGDKHSDMLMLYKLADNSANLYIFNQSQNFQNSGWIRTYANSSSWNWNLMKVSTGDENNDGISDLYMLHKLTDGGANFYTLHGGSAAFGDYSSPAKNFPGNTWLWDNMLAPTYVQ